MKQKISLGSSISLLIGSVIAVLAFVRGKWEIPLLLAVFGLWGLWVILSLLIPSWRANRAYKLKEQENLKLLTHADLNTGVAQALLCHVNYRISDHLKAAYPNVRWEFFRSAISGLISL